mgnify:CR=1 FL=1
MFKEMWQRFTYNGASAKEQAVYYFNLKEITDKLDIVIEQLESIKRGQYELCCAVEQGNKKANEIYISALKTQHYAELTAENSSVATYIAHQAAFDVNTCK